MEQYDTDEDDDFKFDNFDSCSHRSIPASSKSSRIQAIRILNSSSGFALMAYLLGTDCITDFVAATQLGDASSLSNAPPGKTWTPGMNRAFWDL